MADDKTTEVVRDLVDEVRKGFSEQTRKELELTSQIGRLSVRVEQMVNLFDGNGQTPLMERLVTLEVQSKEMDREMVGVKKRLDETEKDANSKRWQILVMLVSTAISVVAAVVVGLVKSN